MVTYMKILNFWTIFEQKCSFLYVWVYFQGAYLVQKGSLLWLLGLNWHYTVVSTYKTLL